MKEWLENATHEALITSEAKVALDKYDTMEDAVAGGLDAQRKVGKPFKLPESMDKLPDDNVRGEFRTGALKILGSVDNVDALKDFDFKVGMAEGAEMTEADTAVATAFAQHVVDTKMPLSIAKQNVEFYNKLMAKAKQDSENQYIENAKNTNTKLVEMLNGQENMTKQAELIKRMFKDEAGLSAEEYVSIADALIEHKYTHSAVLQKALGNMATKLSAEGTTEGGTGVAKVAEHKQTPYEWKKARWPKSPDMWGKPEDTWDTQSVQVRKQAGFKVSAKV